MPTMRLTDLSVKALKPTDTYVTYWSDTTPGFGIRVGKRSRTWTVLRGRDRQRLTVGRYPDMSLAEARAEAKQLLAETRPQRRQEPPSLSFGKAKDEYLATLTQSSRWPHIVRLTFERVYRHLDGQKLADITDTDIRIVLDKLAATPSAQLHAFRVARTFFKWCCRSPRRYLHHSPMEGYEAPGRDRRGSRTLTDDELTAVWNASNSGARRVVRLLLLWGTRNGETAALRRKWRSEGVMTIPGTATKNGRAHSIPLLPLATSILDSQPDTGDCYFPGRRSGDQPINVGSLNRIHHEIMEETGTSGWTLRDLRRTFRSNMARFRVPRDVCEALINHAPPVLDDIYDKYDRFDEKREALARYEAFVLQLTGSGAT